MIGVFKRFLLFAVLIFAQFRPVSSLLSLSTSVKRLGSSIVRTTARTSSIFGSSNDPSTGVRLVGRASKVRSRPRKNFSRTNRVDGQRKWVSEIRILREQKQHSKDSHVNELALIIEVSKELLYSGIPEQVLELYAAYYDNILLASSSENMAKNSEAQNQLLLEEVTESPVVPDIKLILIVTRAFIALGDVKGALQLLHSCSRVGLNFDAESKSLLMEDLAVCSPEGLQAALQLRVSMLGRGERVGAKGAAGLLRGVLQHGLPDLNPDPNPTGLYSSSASPSPLAAGISSVGATLLADAARRWEILAEEQQRTAAVGGDGGGSGGGGGGEAFRLSPTNAESLALDIAEEYLLVDVGATGTGTGTGTDSTADSTGTKKVKKRTAARTHKIALEVIRIVFRTAAASTTTTTTTTTTTASSSSSRQNQNANQPSTRSSSSQARQQRYSRGDRYDLVDFQLDAAKEREQQALSGLQASLSFMAHLGLRWDLQTADVLMDECFRVGDITGVQFVTQQMWERNIQARTSTFNSLLRRYAENGDSESAFLLVTEVMMSPSNNPFKRENEADSGEGVGLVDGGDSLAGSAEAAEKGEEEEEEEEGARYTEPNSETWALLLRSCLKSKKGRYFGKLVTEELLKSENESVVTKEVWDLILQHAILAEADAIPTTGSSPSSTSTSSSSSPASSSSSTKRPPPPPAPAPPPKHLQVLADMIVAQVQPDDASIFAMYAAFRQLGDAAAAVKLYSLQRKGELQRLRDKRAVMDASSSAFDSSSSSSSSSANSVSLNRSEDGSGPPAVAAAAVTEAVTEAAAVGEGGSLKEKFFQQVGQSNYITSLTVKDGTERVSIPTPINLAQATGTADVNIPPQQQRQQQMGEGEGEEDEQKERERLISMSLPPPSTRTVHCLLELLRDTPQQQQYAAVKGVLRDAVARARQLQQSQEQQSSSNNNDADEGSTKTSAQQQTLKIKKAKNMQYLKSDGDAADPILIAAAAKAAKPSEPRATAAVTADSSRQLLHAQYAPDHATFALVMEACIAQYVNSNESPSSSSSGSMLEEVLALVEEMESDWGLAPDRRVYASLIRAFGLYGDIPGALGVFEEMSSQYIPDIGTLQSILDVCSAGGGGGEGGGDGMNLRLLCPVLETLELHPDIDLEVYSRDVLMSGFSDAVSLGQALESMEQQSVPEGCELVSASFAVLSVLVQAVRINHNHKSHSIRSGSGGNGVDSSSVLLQQSLHESLRYLGSVGIRPDQETMEYFRIPEAPALNSPGSSHYNQRLVPNKIKQRSVLDDADNVPAPLRHSVELGQTGYGSGSGTGSVPKQQQQQKQGERVIVSSKNSQVLDPTTSAGASISSSGGGSTGSGSSSSSSSREPYFEPGQNAFADHSSALLKLMHGDFDDAGMRMSDIFEGMESEDAGDATLATASMQEEEEEEEKSNSTDAASVMSITSTTSTSIDDLWQQQQRPPPRAAAASPGIRSSGVAAPGTGTTTGSILDGPVAVADPDPTTAAVPTTSAGAGNPPSSASSGGSASAVSSKASLLASFHEQWQEQQQQQQQQEYEEGIEYINDDVDVLNAFLRQSVGRPAARYGGATGINNNVANAAFSTAVSKSLAQYEEEYVAATARTGEDNLIVSVQQFYRSQQQVLLQSALDEEEEDVDAAAATEMGVEASTGSGNGIDRTNAAAASAAGMAGWTEEVQQQQRRQEEQRLRMLKLAHSSAIVKDLMKLKSKNREGRKRESVASSSSSSGSTAAAAGSGKQQKKKQKEQQKQQQQQRPASGKGLRGRAGKATTTGTRRKNIREVGRRGAGAGN